MDVAGLRTRAVCHTLFPPVELKTAIERLGFVQADPIRAPARAQDLILRHRVAEYRSGDLERHYESLGIEEELLYAYGFVPRPVWQWIQPRGKARLTRLEREVLEEVRGLGRTHPRQLESTFGRDRVVNAWGGYSKATKCALEQLHHYGLLRVAGRENGIRIYEPAPMHPVELSPRERLWNLLRLVVNLLAPVPEKTVLSIGARLRGAADHRAVLRRMIDAGEIEKQSVDGLVYLWPAGAGGCEEAPRCVRFLAPFDPVVWDRLRFEHLWGWAYRFEAYTPVAKRVRGYYAMPLLWGDRVIGWANAELAAGELKVDVGFEGKRPKDGDFRRELDAEIARLRAQLPM